MTAIAAEYQIMLESTVGANRVSAYVIHEGKDLCISSQEREILLTIQAIQRSDHDVHWLFRESIYGKSLVLPVSQHVSTKLTKFADTYKGFFEERIQQIIDRYDSKPLDTEKRAFYERVKASYSELSTSSHVDFVAYKRIRDLFEEVRS